MILKNDGFRAFMRNWHSIITRQFIDKQYIFSGLAMFLVCLPKALKKRILIQKGRLASDEEMSKWFI